MLRKIRIGLGIMMLVSITFLFVDTSSFAASHLSWLAHIQILPAFMGGAFITVAVLLLLTFLLGRVYCSVICPMGLLQDLFARLGRRAKPRRYSYSKEKRILRLSVLALFILCMVTGVSSVVALLAPYSSFGRIAQNIFQPVYQLCSNLVATVDEAVGGYNVGVTDVWIRTIPVFAIALVTLLIIAILAWQHGRTYCNTICPVGTILGYVSKFSILAPIIDTSKCVNCHLCEKNCKAASINIKGKGSIPYIDKSRCVSCFNCIDTCPRGAISYSWRRPTNTTSKPQAQTDSSLRSFLTGVGVLAATAASAQKDKVVDGGLTILDAKVPPKRTTELVPPGSRSIRNFTNRCTGCQLCVAQCPNGVLRPSTSLMTLMQPRMSFERGYCRPDCNLCSHICPAGAISPLSLSAKVSTQIGHAIWVADRCVVNTESTSCGNCARHCPNGAISMVKSPDNPDLRIPAVNEERCIGCGACEHVCPSRPLSAIYVEGHENHKEV